MKSRTSSAFLPFGLGCPILFRGRERGDRRDRTLFRERGGEAGRKEHRPDLEGKDTRRGAESGTGGCLWAAAGFSHRGVGGLALIPVPALRALGLGALAVLLLPGLLLVPLVVLRHKISPQQ